MTRERRKRDDQMLVDKVPAIRKRAHPAHATTPVLKRVQALRFNLVDASELRCCVAIGA